jgi:hypothetical protein
VGLKELFAGTEPAPKLDIATATRQQLIDQAVVDIANGDRQTQSSVWATAYYARSTALLALAATRD